MYNLKAILDKQPVAIASALRSVLFVLVLAGLLVMDEKLLASIALTAEIVLALFVWNGSVPVSTARVNEAQAFAAGAEAGSKAAGQDAAEEEVSHVATEDIPNG